MCRQGVHLLRELHVLFIRESKIWFSERIKLNRPRWAIIKFEFWWCSMCHNISGKIFTTPYLIGQLVRPLHHGRRSCSIILLFFFFSPLNFSSIKVAIVWFWWIQNILITGFVIVKRFWCYLNQWLVFGYEVIPISFPMPLTSFDVRRSFWIGFTCKRFLTRKFFSLY